MTARSWAKLLTPVAASILGLVALRLLGPGLVDQKTVSGWIRPFGDLAPLAFVFFLSVRPLTLLPGQVFTAVGGILFGTLMATVYAMIGSCFAMMLVFVLSQRFGKRLMKRLARGKYQAIRNAARHHDFKFAVLATINPLIPTDVAVAAAAASGARFWPTVGGVMLATLPGTFLTAQFGSALSQGKTIMTVVSATGMVVSLLLGLMLGRQVMHEINDEENAERPKAPAAASPPAAGTSDLLPGN